MHFVCFELRIVPTVSSLRCLQLLSFISLKLAFSTVNGNQGFWSFRQSLAGLSPQGSGLDLLPDHVEFVVKTLALR
jgi:hypothetical protein